MKTYQCNPTAKKCAVSYFIMFTIVLVMVIIMGQGLDILESLLYLSATVIFIIALQTVYTLKINVDDEKIELDPCHGGKTNLLWREIEEVETNYFLFPEKIAWFTLVPKSDSSKKKLFILFSAVSIEFAKDVFSHLSPDTKLHLYPYLKKKLENK